MPDSVPIMQLAISSEEVGKKINLPFPTDAREIYEPSKGSSSPGEANNVTYWKRNVIYSRRLSSPAPKPKSTIGAVFMGAILCYYAKLGFLFCAR